MKFDKNYLQNCNKQENSRYKISLIGSNYRIYIRDNGIWKRVGSDHMLTLDEALQELKTIHKNINIVDFYFDNNLNRVGE